MSQIQTPLHTFVPTWTLGDRLLRARKSRGLSQAELAEAIGIHQRSISNYEADVTVPNWAIIRAWASECQINLSWLATGDPYADPPGPGTWAAGMDRGPLMEAFVQYQRGRAFSEKTIRRRATAINSFLDYLEPAGLAEATPNDVEEWLRGFPGSQTRYSYRSDVKMLYRWAVRRDIASLNPVDDTDPPRLPKRLPRPLQPDDLAAALSVADGDVQLMMLLGAFAGLRISEIAALSTANIHLHRVPAVLMIDQGKGHKDRIVPLHPTLAARLGGIEPGWVFPGRDGHLQPSTVAKRISRVFGMLGIVATPHQLRHTFGTEFARVAKGNLVAVANVMGHESVNTTQLYVGWSPETAGMVAEMYAS